MDPSEAKKKVGGEGGGRTCQLLVILIKKSYLIWKPVDEYGLYLHYLMVFNELGPIFRINGDQNEPVLDRRLANVCTTCQLHVILIRKKLLDLETS